jgi:phage tail sheath protein FI
MIFLEKAISTAAKFQLFEFNDTFSRRAFVSTITPFLRRVQSQRGITDFRVVCDETNNTDDIVSGNKFVADIFIKPAISTNFINLNFVALRQDAVFTETTS